MNSKTKKYITLIGLAILGMVIFKSIIDDGVIKIFKCSDDYILARCLGVDNNSSITFMNDFYTHLSNEKSALAWNLLSEKQKLEFINMPNRPKGKDHFYSFWNEEIDKFIIIQGLYRRGVGESVDIGVTICHKRHEDYARLNDLEGRFCSDDKFHLIKKKSKDSPYYWQIDYIRYNQCNDEDKKVCDAFDFQNKPPEVH